MFMRTETESSQKGGFGNMDEKLHVTSARKLAINNTNLMAAIKQTDMGKMQKNGIFCILQAMLHTLPKEQTILVEAVLQFFG